MEFVFIHVPIYIKHSQYLKGTVFALMNLLKQIYTTSIVLLAKLQRKSHLARVCQESLVRECWVQRNSMLMCGSKSMQLIISLSNSTRATVARPLVPRWLHIDSLLPVIEFV